MCGLKSNPTRREDAKEVKGSTYGVAGPRWTPFRVRVGSAMTDTLNPIWTLIEEADPLPLKVHTRRLVTPLRLAEPDLFRG